MSEYTEALRKLADCIEAHPEIPTGLSGVRINAEQGGNLNIHLAYGGSDDALYEQMEQLRAVRRAIHGDWDKTYNGDRVYYQQKDVFGFFTATIFVDRDAVCERKLVKVETIEHEASEAWVEKKPVYEWDCKPSRELVGV